MLKLLIQYHQISEIYRAMVDHNFSFAEDEYKSVAFLDLDTVEVHYILASLINTVEELDLPLATLTEEDLPLEVDIEKLRLYQKIDFELGKRYIKLPDMEAWHGYNDMQAFIDQEDDPKLKNTLFTNIQGKGAFGRFKEVLALHPGKMDEWYHFETLQQFHRIKGWLLSVDLELDLFMNSIPDRI